jgi:hypothetical protein
MDAMPKITVRVPADLRARLESEAEADQRPVTALIRKILTDRDARRPKGRHKQETA